MKLGLYGGTFDPPHIGHGEIVSFASGKGLFDKLLVLPSGNPPHKKGVTDMKFRYEMASLAFSDKAELCDFEMNAKRSYTVETAKHFFSVTGEKNVLVMGGDSFRDFFSWYKPEEILSYCDLAVFPRVGADYSETLDRVKASGAKIDLFGDRITDVSSTRLKTDLRFGMDVTGRVIPEVISYIKANGLYGEFSEIISKLKSALKPSRFAHTYRVALKALEMNATVGLDGEKVFLASILHDCAKYVSPEECGFIPPEGMPESVYHAFEGAVVAEKVYGVKDEEILDAIRYHCTGCDEMKPFEKLVYVADYIEDGRGAYAEPVRKVFAGYGLDAAYEKARSETERFLLSEGKKSFECRRGEIK